jgi:membrane protein DedA with SNARE-associated domain
MLHDLFAFWMQRIHDWGYAGVFWLMALESTVFPIPSEIVVPPAAYWVSEGRLSFWGVVLASTFGSWLGSAVSYLVARRLGRPLILRYGKYLFLPEKKWALAEEWINRYSVVGIFFARLLPVVRHLVSLPAGAARMRFLPFTVSTLLGSFVWSWVLAEFGRKVLGGRPELLTDPDALTHVLKDELGTLVLFVFAMLVAYIGIDLLARRWRTGHGRG